MLGQLYDPYPLVVESARGIRIKTDKGEFLDTFSGIGVLPLGHSHPDVVDAITRKASRYCHLSNYFIDPDAAALAELLASRAGGGTVIFTNSGAESNEAAIKAVRRHKKGMIVSFKGSFHGRTCGAVSLTSPDSIRVPFEPLLADTAILPRDGGALLDYAASHEVAGIFVECVLGSGGVVPIEPSFAEAVLEVRRKYGCFVVADEIQAGLGRTGKFFAYQHYALDPDIITCGKGVGGGIPLGAVIFTREQLLVKGEHGTTFAPNPVASAAGRATLERLSPELIASVDAKGKLLRSGLESLPWVTGTRGLGLFVAALTDSPALAKAKALENGVLLNVTSGVVRFLPALNITDDEIKEIINKLRFTV